MATIFCTATSLDGYIADDQESLSWLFATQGDAPEPDYPVEGASNGGGGSGSGSGSGSTVPETDASPTASQGLPRLHFSRFFSGVGAIVGGYNTFDWVRRDLTANGEPFTWPYSQPTWIVTHRDLEPTPGVHTFSGDVAELHPRLVEAAAGKDVWVLGGGDLAGQFADHGLLDQVWIHQCPVVLGSGRPLLPRRLRLNRRDVETDGQFTAMLFDVVGPEPRPVD